MTAIQVSGSLIFVFSFVVCCLAGNDHNAIATQQQKAVDSLKSPEIGQFQHDRLLTAMSAQREMEEFQAKVAKGDISIENNNGVWCVVFNESKTVVKSADYASKNGPITNFMKTVYADADHKTQVNEQSYHFNFFTNGMIKSYIQADMQEMTEYYPDGKIKSISVKTDHGYRKTKLDNRSR